MGSGQRTGRCTDPRIRRIQLGDAGGKLCERIDDGSRMMTVLDGLKNGVISTIESYDF